jgi:hypothetical protein
MDLDDAVDSVLETYDLSPSEDAVHAGRTMAPLLD